MSFNAASFVLASSGPYRLWLYSTTDNLASIQVTAGNTDYFKLANCSSREGGVQGVRKGDIILATNSGSQQVTTFGVTSAFTYNAGSVLAQTNNAASGLAA